MVAHPFGEAPCCSALFLGSWQEETGVSSCGGRNLLKGAIALGCFVADGGKMLQGAKKKKITGIPTLPLLLPLM